MTPTRKQVQDAIAEVNIWQSAIPSGDKIYSVILAALRAYEGAGTVEQNQCDSGISRVYELCNRYESGYGHGLKRDGLDLSKTPHSDAEMGEAYQIGYEAGSERYVEPPEVRSDESVTWQDERSAFDAWLIKEYGHKAHENTVATLGKWGAWQARASLCGDPIGAIESHNNTRVLVWLNETPIEGTKLFTHPAPSHVAGMVSVPIEPTDEMIKIGVDIENKTFNDADEGTLLSFVRSEQVRAAYKAMIAIAGKEKT